MCTYCTGLVHGRMDLLIFFLKVESNYEEICGLARLKIIKVIKKNTMTPGEKNNLTDKSLKGFYFGVCFSVTGMA